MRRLGLLLAFVLTLASSLPDASAARPRSTTLRPRPAMTTKVRRTGVRTIRVRPHVRRDGIHTRQHFRVRVRR